ncbi:hypothetical protein [Streptomyces sp. SAJ15]|uniref:hypothetical protein n=1 Tax=Streptomyces sp. SAJ15 TaxID=2011095 RepID=UPI0021B2F1DA|nr:hypothetical protein [Streptomyces sp. SAJ15]
MGERNFIALIDGTHHLVKAPNVGHEASRRTTEPKHDSFHLRCLLTCGFVRAKHVGCHRIGTLAATSSARSMVGVTGYGGPPVA